MLFFFFFFFLSVWMFFLCINLDWANCMWVCVCAINLEKIYVLSHLAWSSYWMCNCLQVKSKKEKERYVTSIEKPNRNKTSKKNHKSFRPVVMYSNLMILDDKKKFNLYLFLWCCLSWISATEWMRRFAQVPFYTRNKR